MDELIQNRDAWSSCAGLTRPEAKSAYISALISTMHTYAYGTPEARELVNELEFVWDQVRCNNGTTTKEGLRLLRPVSDRDDGDEGQLANENEEESPEAEQRRQNDALSSWQSRVDGALVQMTAEIAALREVVVEARSRRVWTGGNGSRQSLLQRVLGKVWWALWMGLLVDAVFVVGVVVVVRWRNNGGGGWQQELVRFWGEWKEKLRRRLFGIGRRKEGG